MWGRHIVSLQFRHLEILLQIIAGNGYKVKWENNIYC